MFELTRLSRYKSTGHALLSDDQSLVLVSLAFLHDPLRANILFSTHYNYKNIVYNSDNWLLVTRWEQLMSFRNTITFAELVSWWVHLVSTTSVD